MGGCEQDAHPCQDNDANFDVSDISDQRSHPYQSCTTLTV